MTPSPGAMVVAIGTGDVFSKGRDFGAWLGLVPKSHTASPANNLTEEDRTACAHEKVVRLLCSRNDVARAGTPSGTSLSCNWFLRSHDLFLELKVRTPRILTANQVASETDGGRAKIQENIVR
jgi:hypothetical protein